MAVLPKPVLEVVDTGSLALVQADFVSQKLKERFSDALFSASFRGTPGYIWFLVEHKSEPERFVALQVLGYIAELWQRLTKLEPGRSTLPPVVCVVVHHGESAWNQPTRLCALVDGLEGLPELGRLVPDFEIIVDDLVKQPDEALKSRELPVFPKVVLWVLRDVRTIERFLERIEAWSGELGRLARESPEDMLTVLRYIFNVVGDESFESVRKRIIEAAPATEEPMATAAEQLIQRGRAQGKAEGEAKGKAEAVLAIFEARGVKVAADERVRIVECKDVAELDRWLRKAVTATSAAELFSH